jgi:hypothetical protein
MKLTDLLSIVAIVISTISFLLSFWLNIKSARSDIRPVLAFVYNGESGWHLRNVGSGPALNVTVAQKNVKNREWFNPVRVPPLEEESRFHLKWLGHVNDTGLGVVYEDFQGRTYSSTCGNDLSCVFRGRGEIPKWEEQEIGRHWRQPLYRSGG